MPNRQVADAAQRKLDHAIDEFFREMGWDRGVTTGWALISHQHLVDDEGDVNSSHNIAYMGGSLPDHVAAGLFLIGLDTVRGLGRFGLGSGDTQPD